MRPVRLRRVRVLAFGALTDARAGPSPADLRAEFPTLVIERHLLVGGDPSTHAATHESVEEGEALVDAAVWRTAPRFEPFDVAILGASRGTVVVRGAATEVDLAAWQTLTRWQRLIGRRNAASTGPRFDRLLLAHAELHASADPLVRADLDHALDTWQWILRLDGAAPLALQIAALFHHVEHLESEALRRIERRAPNDPAFEDAGGPRGGARTYDVLRAAGLDASSAARAAHVVAIHEARGRDPAADRLKDAHALSFFSLSSAAYLDYFGAAQTRRAIADALARLGPRARAHLERVKLRPDVARLLGDVRA